MSDFPTGGSDEFYNPTGSQPMDQGPQTHSQMHTLENEAIDAVETALTDVFNISSATTAVAWGEYNANASGGAFTVTLPAGVGKVWVSVTKTDSSANAVTVACNTGQTFADGTTSVSLSAQNVGGWWVFDGTSKWTVRGVQPGAYVPAVTPEAYGAKGDGVTDDAAAIQAMFNAISSGAYVWMGKTYAMSVQVAIPTSCTVEGSWGNPANSVGGDTGTVLQPTSAATQGAMASLLAVQADFVTLRGLCFKGTGSGNGGVGVSFAGTGKSSHGAVTQKCRVERFGTGVLMDAASDHVTLYDCAITNNNDGVEIASGNENDYSFIGCLLDGNTRSSVYLPANVGTTNLSFLRTHLGFSQYGILQDKSTTIANPIAGLTMVASPIEHVSVQHIWAYSGGWWDIDAACYWTWNGTPADAACHVTQASAGPFYLRQQLVGSNASSPALFEIGSYTNESVYLNGDLGGFASAWYTSPGSMTNFFINGIPQFSKHQAVTAADEPDASTGAYSSYVVATANPAFYGMQRYQGGTPAINDSISYDLVLGDGTWTFVLLSVTGTVSGQVQLQLDGTNIGSIIDTYAGSAGTNRTVATGVAVSGSGGKKGSHRLTILVTGKNASSTNFYYAFSGLTAVKTA